MKQMFFRFILILSVLFPWKGFSQVVEIKIKGLKNNKGVLQIAVFSGQEQFEKEKAFSEHFISKIGIVNGELTMSLEMEPGVYGIALLDDEDCNGKMKYNLLGIPLEGFGFSNYKSSGLSKPRFSDFCFHVTQQGAKVLVQKRYVL